MPQEGELQQHMKVGPCSPTNRVTPDLPRYLHPQISATVSRFPILVPFDISPPCFLSKRLPLIARFLLRITRCIENSTILISSVWRARQSKCFISQSIISKRIFTTWDPRRTVCRTRTADLRNIQQKIVPQNVKHFFLLLKSVVKGY